jgi:hypothetical protein
MDRNEERMAVQTRAFMALRHIGQPVSGFDTKFFVNLHYIGGQKR